MSPRKSQNRISGHMHEGDNELKITTTTKTKALRLLHHAHTQFALRFFQPAVWTLDSGYVFLFLKNKSKAKTKLKGRSTNKDSHEIFQLSQPPNDQ